jgi:Zn-dependent protease with chaperone function
MIRRVWLFSLILGVPLFGFAVSEGIQAHLNSELRLAMRQQYPDLDPSIVAQLSFDQICETPNPELHSLCSTNRNLNLMSAAAVWAGSIGLILLLMIRIAGSVAQTNRSLLLSLFTPGLYLTAVLLIGLVVVHGTVAIAAIYYGESTFLGRIHIGVIVAIGLGALLGIAALIPNVFSLVSKAETFVLGTEITRKQAPELWQRVEEIANQLGALRPEHVVVGLDPNFFVTEADVVCLNAKLSGRTLYCSLPFCRILNKEEFSAVIGHELGHYKGLDTHFSQKFFPIYRGTTSAIASLQETGDEGSKMIALLPAIAVLSYFLECFSIAESRISRVRELAADQEGATATHPASLASALVKLHAFAGTWEALRQAAVSAIHEGKALVNASKTYAEVVAGSTSADVFNEIGETHLSHPTDSHPPLAVRLDALKTSIKDVSAAALDVRPTAAAIELFPGAEEVEENISGAYQAILAREYGISIESEATAS